MKALSVNLIATLLLMVFASGAVAQATTGAGYSFEEVPADEAQRIAPLTPEVLEQIEHAQRAQTSNAPGNPAFDVVTIAVGAVILDALINLGKAVWDLYESGRPKMDVTTDVASAVPQGIQDWTQLEGWKDPVSKLYKTQLLRDKNYSLGDIYFRLVFSYGGSFQGKGQYLANVTVIPAQVTVPYWRDFYAKTQVLQLLNQGTKTNPIAGMTMNLTWGVTSWGGNTVQSIALHIRGDGGVEALPAADDQAETISAPVKAPGPSLLLN